MHTYKNEDERQSMVLWCWLYACIGDSKAPRSRLEYVDDSTREGVNGTRWVLHALVLSSAYRRSHQSSNIRQQVVSKPLGTSGDHRSSL